MPLPLSAEEKALGEVLPHMDSIRADARQRHDAELMEEVEDWFRKHEITIRRVRALTEEF